MESLLNSYPYIIINQYPQVIHQNAMWKRLNEFIPVF